MAFSISIQKELILKFACFYQGLQREDRGSNQVELFSADFTSKSAAKNLTWLVSAPSLNSPWSGPVFVMDLLDEDCLNV